LLSNQDARASVWQVAGPQWACRAAAAADGMTSDPLRTATPRKIWAFLAQVVSDCGGLLNSLMVAIGDRVGLYKTGQYSSDMKDN
jgi:hypothetical protein